MLDKKCYNCVKSVYYDDPSRTYCTIERRDVPLLSSCDCFDDTEPTDTPSLPDVTFVIWDNQLNKRRIISMKYREELVLPWFHEHDEGIDRGESSITYEREGIFIKSYSVFTDCDGRIDSYTNAYCPIDRLWEKNVYEKWSQITEQYIPIVKISPEWIRLGSSQRDYTAESMGY